MLQSWISYRGAEQISVEIVRRTQSDFGWRSRLLTGFLDEKRLPHNARDIDYVLPPKTLQTLMRANLLLYLLIAPIALTFMAVKNARSAELVNPQNPPTELAAGVARLIHRRPTVWMCHSLPPVVSWSEARDPLEWLIWQVARSPLGRWSRMQNDAIIAVSKRLATRIKDDSGRSAICVYPPINRLLYEGADRNIGREKLGIASSAPVLIVAGTVAKRKNQLILVEAMPELCQRWPDLQLIIAGDGRGEAALRVRAAQLAIADHVHLVGYVPSAELRHLYAAADLNVAPQWIDEGCTLTPFEALIAGTLSVVARDSGADELIEPWQAGWIWEHDEPLSDAIARALVVVLAGAHQTMLDRGRAGVNAELAYEHHMLRIDEIFRSTMSRSNTSQPNRIGLEP